MSETRDAIAHPVASEGAAGARPPGILQVAFAPRTVRRALRYAVIVGAVLIGINHGDALLRGEWDGDRLLRMGLTVLVPYTVSTLSSVEATREQARAARARARPAEREPR